MSTLGLAIITFNEEQHISEVIKSVPFATEVVVVDSFSTDNTVKLASQAGAKVIQQEWQGYSKQKQFCLEQITTDWILVLDGDEVLSKELANEIEKLITGKSQFDAYFLKRHLFFLNRELKHGRGIDFQLRLLKKGIGKYSDRNIHEEILVDCATGKLTNPIYHYSSDTIQDELEKIKRDTEMELTNYNYQEMGIKEILIQPLTFFITMLIKGSWKDGIPGIIFLLLTTIKYIIMRAKFYEANISKGVSN